MRACWLTLKPQWPGRGAVISLAVGALAVAGAIGGELGKIDQFVPPSAQDLLADERAGMVCSRLQARVAVGPDTCAALDAMAADLQTPWALRQTLLYAQEWQRNHRSMDELGWALGYDPAQIDDMFRLAMTL